MGSQCFVHSEHSCVIVSNSVSLMEEAYFLPHERIHSIIKCAVILSWMFLCEFYMYLFSGSIYVKYVIHFI